MAVDGLVAPRRRRQGLAGLGAPDRRVARVYGVEDFERAAAKRLPRAIFDVIDGGAGDEVTVRGNRAAMERVWLQPRPLVDVHAIDVNTTVLGTPVSMPLLLAPCSLTRLCHPEAELAVARAAGRAGTVYVIAGGSSETVEDIAQVARGPLWYQLYMQSDPGVNAALVERARAAGYGALCVTIDTPFKPYREKDLRNGVNVPLKVTPELLQAGLSRPRWARDFLRGTTLAGSGLGVFKKAYRLAASRRSYHRQASSTAHVKSVLPEDIEWLRDRWPGKLVVKGVLSGAAVPLLADLGVDGVIVSNHGGRNLDGAVPTLDALPEVVEAADDRLEVLIDGGIRRGTDVVKALALGARAVLVGRPYLFALAAAGETGVQRLLELLRDDIHRTMGFAGVTSIAEIDRSLLH